MNNALPNPAIQSTVGFHVGPHTPTSVSLLRFFSTVGKRLVASGVGLALILMASTNGTAGTFDFSTGDPDGRIATASRPGSAGKIEVESGDDFVLNTPVSINQATFTGLLTGATLSDIGQVTVEIYRVFPKDSQNPPSGNVPTRVNSPADVALEIRDSAAANLTFNVSVIDPTFTAQNSVQNGINPSPNQQTGGEGPITGQEVQFNVTFTTPLDLAADHYFFVPQVELTGAGAEFYWLSAPRPIVPPGTPFAPDLQSWIRNANLDPDWLRIGTDIVGGSPAPAFNASFSLSGHVPDTTWTFGLLGVAFAGMASLGRRQVR